MYIPFSYWGASNLCISASGGDRFSYHYSDSTLYKVHEFTTPGNHTYEIHSGSALHKLAIIGAGGSGGVSIDLNRYGGGGGAGGFLFLDNLQISSGSYDIYVGEGFECNIVSGGYTCSTNPNLLYPYPQSISGESSSFQYTFTPTSPDSGYYIPSSSLSAYGGGAGSSQYRVCPDDGTSQGYAGENGASGGGGAQWGDGTASPKDVRNGRALFNSTGLSPHGFNGGTIISSSTVTGGSGGGGADYTGSSNNGTAAAAGGGGLYLQDFLPYSGSVCFGGYGGSPNTTPQEQPFGSGSGGVGVDGDIPAELPLTKGKDGMVLVFYPICATELRNCTTYNINGGQYGGTVKYISCITGLIESASIGSNQSTSMCNYVAGIYPHASGDVTLTSSADCSIILSPEPFDSECVAWRFNAGVSGGTATYTLCGELTSSTEAVSASSYIDRCTVSGSVVSISGEGSTLTLLGDCTPTGAVSESCEEWRFDGGNVGGGTATYTLCNEATQSSQFVPSGSYVDLCITSGSSKGITGISTSINFLNDC